MTTGMNEERPFNPSWLDRFNDWVKGLRIGAWVFFIVLGFTLVVIQLLFLLFEGDLQATDLLPVVIFNGFFIPFFLALIFFLDDQAVSALKSMRPVLELTEPEFERTQYSLSNMPFGMALLAGLALTVFTIFLETLWITPVRYAPLDQLPIFQVVYQIVDKGGAFVFGVFIYHTIRQLRLVNAINNNYIRVSLFNLGPLQAFSRLTASTAVGLVVGVYSWMLINPDLLWDPIVIGIVGFITILAIVVFVLPLFGVHRQMRMEKERLLYDLDQDLESVFSKFNRAFHNDDYSAIERLNGIIASLETQRNRINAFPTWPWRSETAQFTFTAITLPLILSIVQFFIVRALE